MLPPPLVGGHRPQHMTINGYPMYAINAEGPNIPQVLQQQLQHQMQQMSLDQRNHPNFPMPMMPQMPMPNYSHNLGQHPPTSQPNSQHMRGNLFADPRHQNNGVKAKYKSTSPLSIKEEGRNRHAIDAGHKDTRRKNVQNVANK